MDFKIVFVRFVFGVLFLLFHIINGLANPLDKIGQEETGIQETINHLKEQLDKLSQQKEETMQKKGWGPEVADLEKQAANLREQIYFLEKDNINLKEQGDLPKKEEQLQDDAGGNRLEGRLENLKQQLDILERQQWQKQDLKEIMIDKNAPQEDIDSVDQELEDIGQQIKDLVNQITNLKK